ncbi:exported hypothetical protein [Cupriavidus oxalaticus]|uniref:Uncharacterized protein n=1 Tax=Cupriavidus oxalaticus TaxID=96344 RepID=A0A375GDX9_9BURK|nr:exported hypothetical protein [Cupriavidus oxalaticus]
MQVSSTSFLPFFRLVIVFVVRAAAMAAGFQGRLVVGWVFSSVGPQGLSKSRDDAKMLPDTLLCFICGTSNNIRNVEQNIAASFQKL